jgi:CheY-like chemotaxis protein
MHMSGPLDQISTAVLHTALVVEDEFLVRFDIVDALARAELNVVDFASGEEALAWLERGNTPDVLVTDIRLSGSVDGWDVARRIHALHPAVRVDLSATPSDPSRQTPGSRFLPKPYPRDQLIRTVRQALAER